MKVNVTISESDAGTAVQAADVDAAMAYAPGACCSHECRRRRRRRNEAVRSWKHPRAPLRFMGLAKAAAEIHPIVKLAWRVVSVAYSPRPRHCKKPSQNPRTPTQNNLLLPSAKAFSYTHGCSFEEASTYLPRVKVPSCPPGWCLCYAGCLDPHSVSTMLRTLFTSALSGFT